MFKSMKRIIKWAGKYKGRLYLGSVFSFFSSSWSLKKTNHCVQGWGSVDFSIVCCFIILGG